METDGVEYLLEWPPPVSSSARVEEDQLASEVNSLSATNPSAGSPPTKRLKYAVEHGASEGQRLDKSSCSEKGSPRKELQQQLSLEEMHIVQCDGSVLADALLARWWKMASKKLEHNVSWIDANEEERVVPLIKSNAARPQTQLYHISR